MLQRIITISGIFFVTALLYSCAAPVKEEVKPAEAQQQKKGPAFFDEAIEAAKAGRTEQAIELLQKVIDANPEFAVAYTDLGLQYLQQDKLDEAEQAFSKSISLDSGDFVAYNHRGVILRKKGEFTDAEKMYLQALKHNPDYANAHLNLAVLYDIYMYNLEQAMFHYKKYQSLTSEDDALVGKWVVDLERRISAAKRGK